MLDNPDFYTQLPKDVQIGIRPFIFQTCYVDLQQNVRYDKDLQIVALQPHCSFISLPVACRTYMSLMVFNKYISE